MEKTIYLTPQEIAKIDSVHRFGSATQDAMLELRKRSGIRYGSCVAKGKFAIVTTAFAIGKNGEPRGLCKTEVIRGSLTRDELVPAIRELISAL